MTVEKVPEKSDAQYWIGVLVGLVVGGILFWVTMQILIAMR
jgi:tetrahydromethanopterin S-methyltransferase subunit G